MRPTLLQPPLRQPGLEPSTHQNQKLVEARITRVLNERIVPAVYSLTAPVSLRAWAVPGEPVPFAEAIKQPFTPFAVGERWGSAWSTWWFDLTAEIPASWRGLSVELLLDLGFHGDQTGFQAEGLLYDPAGAALKGIHPRNRYLRVAQQAAGGEQLHFLLEAAANPSILADGFVPTVYGERDTAPSEPLYRFRSAELAVFEPEVWALRFDVEVLDQLLRELPEHEPRRQEILHALERSLDALALDDVVGSAASARAELAATLAKPAHASAHRLAAIGHAHIDTAWLWPIRETKRKAGRTFANVLALADEYPELRFACSQAQQYEWVRERHPDLFARVKAAVAAGQWLPVGSQWVEPDGNLPGGEAMVRQLTTGLRYFREELGVETHGVWLPDSFGYSAALPQIARLAGLRWFLTQKLSWNQVNAFPHHTFWWEGIDGSRIFTHFPPVDTYNSSLAASELHHAVRNFREQGAASTSLVPFGYGDGGGGPTREMLERQRRTRCLEGSPRVEIEAPDDFFARAQAEYDDAPIWVGELYLERHRGTFTSQARSKRGNRESEHRLREAELWSTAATVLAGADYPYQELQQLWQSTLLAQFHDILPGSSIAWVYRENERSYAQSLTAMQQLTEAALRTLTVAEPATSAVSDSASAALSGSAGTALGGSVANTADHERQELLQDRAGTPLALVRVPGSAIAPLVALTPSAPVSASVRELRNELLTVGLDAHGHITSIRDERADRELVPPGALASLLQLHPDLPNEWDAWDIDQHYQHRHQDLLPADSVELVESGPLRATVQVSRSFGHSTVTQLISLIADDPRLHLQVQVDWHEQEKLLKLAFPLALHAQHHSAEIQFGHLRRPINKNTSWDDARFEVMAHRWLHLQEPGYGVALANSSSYGYDVTHTVDTDGEPRTTLRVSLLRGARSPDPTQDQGQHRFDFSLLPGATIADAISAGYAENLPLRLIPSAPQPALPQTASGPAAPPRAAFVQLFTAQSDSIRVEAVKLAGDRSGDVIFRLYESCGGRGEITLEPHFAFVSATAVALTEQPLSPDLPRPRSLTVTDGRIALSLRPFQLVTLRVARSGS